MTNPLFDSPYMRGRVVYQIYPRSFYDGNGDGVGDLEGIIRKLDYLNDGTAESLGVNMIWLSPFYPSPMADFGYDISDYCDVDPLFGTLEDFRRLMQEAHARGIKVMIDFVPNHSSDQHAWFRESRSGRVGPKADWYIWRDGRADGGPPNNWLSVFGGSAWEWDETRRQYYMHSFLAAQPDLNWANPVVRRAMQDAMRFWLELGVDGIRVDAVDWMAKDPGFRDNPRNLHYSAGVDDPYHEFERTRSQDGPDRFLYLHEMARVVKEYPRAFMVTETYPERRNIVERYLELYQNYLAEVSAPFNFEGILLPWQAGAFKSFVDRFQAGLKRDHYLPMYVLGNHDNSRVATRTSERAARTAAMMLLTLPGVAFVYYGDELGMTDAHIPPDRVQDPFEKRVPGMGLGRDPERTPMQWSDEAHAGFSRVEPWLPVAGNFRTHNVTREQGEPGSVWRLYQKLIHLRNYSPILQRGEYRALDLDNAYVFGFLREYGGYGLAVFLNFSGGLVRFRSDLGHGAIMYSTHGDKEGLAVDLGAMTLRGDEGIVVTVM